MEFFDTNNRKIELGHVVEWNRRARKYHSGYYNRKEEKIPAMTLRGRVIKIQGSISKRYYYVDGKYQQQTKIIYTLVVKVIGTNPHLRTDRVAFRTSKNLTIDTTYPREITL